MTLAKITNINNQKFTADKRIIGPRAAGKTTALAALLHQLSSPQSTLRKALPGLQITNMNGEAEQLKCAAEDILLKGQKFAGTRADHHPEYVFRLEVPAVMGLQKQAITVTTKDYAGELFDDLLGKEGRNLQSQQRELKSKLLNDLKTVQGILIMLTDWESQEDEALKNKLEDLFTELGDSDNQDFKQNLRVAIMINKCERGELWPGRFEPEQDIIQVRLPETYELVKDTFNGKNFQRKQLKFFASSAFGVLSDDPFSENGKFDPRPNRILPDDGTSPEYKAILREKSSNRWKPFGLVNPFYWLATGKTLPNPSL